MLTLIYNENKSSFNELWDTRKADIFNSILFAAAALSEPGKYGWTKAQERLNETISSWIPIITWWKLSQLKSFFDENAEYYDELAKNNSEELKEQLTLIAEKNERIAEKKEKIAEKEEEFKKYSAKVDEYSAKVDEETVRVNEETVRIDKMTKLVWQLKWLLD